MTNPTRAELIRLGMSSTLDGGLREFREKVHLSRNAQAQLIEVTPDALKRWEEATQGMNADSALRVGDCLVEARGAVADLEAGGVSMADLVPLSTACQHLSMSANEVEEKCRTGALRCESLGVLGTYVYRRYIPSLEDSTGEE